MISCDVMSGQVWFHLVEGKQLNDDSWNCLDHVFLSYSIHAKIGAVLLFQLQLVPFLFEVSHYPKTLCNAISFVFFIYHFRKTIIILIMHYVYKRQRKTNQENTRIGFYLNRLERYKNDKRGYKDVCPMNI